MLNARSKAVAIDLINAVITFRYLDVSFSICHIIYKHKYAIITTYFSMKYIFKNKDD